MKNMKLFRFLSAATILTALSITLSINTYARVKPSQTQPDSTTVRLADRLEHGSWIFVPKTFTGTNDVRLEFYSDSKDSRDRVTLAGDAISININFIDANRVASAMTPHQMGRAVAGAAAAVRLNGSLPNYVDITGAVKSKEVSIDRKGRYITVEIHYDIENSNIFNVSSSATANLSVDTRYMTAHLIFRNMNVDGTMEGNITIF